eukprot:TRINITY_DN17396_c0_g1_i1.p1 TRINITY_DN17396_c0_g1~~TRINITY_DN17396_c0_g1_i1.p1  ORF type:complete len:497 (-),score=91.81 TRINITY_DN17396_c0_g1_i1:23-1402(-)
MDEGSEGAEGLDEEEARQAFTNAEWIGEGETSEEESTDDDVEEGGDRGEEIWEEWASCDMGQRRPSPRFAVRFSQPVLAHDPLGVFIALLMATPGVPSVRETHALLTLTYALACCQAYLATLAQSFPFPPVRAPSDGAHTGGMRMEGRSKVTTVEVAEGQQQLEWGPASEWMATIEACLLPFLSRVVLLLSLMRCNLGPMAGDVPARGGTGLPLLRDFHSLRRWLGLPSWAATMRHVACREDPLLTYEERKGVRCSSPEGVAFESQGSLSLLSRWLRSSESSLALWGLEGLLNPSEEPRCRRPISLHRVPRAPELMRLPEVYQDLLLATLRQPCKRCNNIPEEPAICLVCGILLCCATECCKKGFRGECSRHSRDEGGGVGLFLLMRSTQLLLMRSERICNAPSLYLDSHGEEDTYMKRGRPLRLSHLRLSELRRLWVHAAFDFDSHILHQSQLGGHTL